MKNRLNDLGETPAAARDREALERQHDEAVEQAMTTASAGLLALDSDIETIVHQVGDAISRDEFSVERVTTELHDRLVALVERLWPVHPTKAMLTAAHLAMQRTTANTPHGQYYDIYRAFRSTLMPSPQGAPSQEVGELNAEIERWRPPAQAYMEICRRFGWDGHVIKHIEALATARAERDTVAFAPKLDLLQRLRLLAETYRYDNSSDITSDGQDLLDAVHELEVAWGINPWEPGSESENDVNRDCAMGVKRDDV